MSDLKDSGSYWLGEIPEDWEMLPAWALFTEGKEKCGADDPHLVPSRVYGVVTRDDLTELSGNKPVDNEASAHNMKHVNPHDFIISMGSHESGIEHSRLVGKVSNDYRVLRPTNDVNPEYYKWFFKSDPLIEGLRGLTTEIRVGQRIHYSRFSLLRLPIPSAADQQRIADYLDRETAEIDAAVADLDRYMELLERRQQVLISNVVNGISGPLAGAEEIPEAPLGTLLSSSITDGPHATPEFLSEGVPFLSVDGIQKGELVFDGCRYISQEDHEEFSKKTRPQKGDILMGKAASTGKIALVRDSFEFSIWSPLAVIRTSDRINSEFLAYALKSSAAQVQIDHLCSFNTQKNIAMRDIPRIRVPFPSQEGQLKAVAYLNREIVQVNALFAESTTLRDLLLKRRSVLITEVVTGRKQV